MVKRDQTEHVETPPEADENAPVVNDEAIQAAIDAALANLPQVRRVDVRGPVTPPAEDRVERENIKVLPLLYDSHNVCVVDMSFRVLPYGPGRGKLDPINRGMTVALRFRRRLQDGTYKFVRTVNLTHSEQVPRRRINNPDGSSRYQMGGRPFAHFCRMGTVMRKDPNTNQPVEIIDPDDVMFVIYQELCDAAEWPNMPPETPPEEEASQAPTAGLGTPDVQHLDDIPYA
jgi:hypothetical protein